MVVLTQILRTDKRNGTKTSLANPQSQALCT